ncbi:hypothetical protein V6N13_134743 [Hibiscus sabdariffa]|uniref:Uncharacterized protein n=1 Tax=Hibiscus sabdariffa TaxID=183260 RepID=A0ABR2R4P2_9ROSI
MLATNITDERYNVTVDARERIVEGEQMSMIDMLYRFGQPSTSDMEIEFANRAMVVETGAVVIAKEESSTVIIMGRGWKKLEKVVRMGLVLQQRVEFEA